jgi:hypothetical protein
VKAGKHGSIYNDERPEKRIATTLGVWNDQGVTIAEECPTFSYFVSIDEYTIR